jgi:hypothetical protein
MRNYKPNSAAAKIASRFMTLRMGAAGMADARLVAGMSAAGLAAGGTVVGKSLLGRVGAVLIPGLGWAMLGASAATGVYAAYKDYQKTGSPISALKAFGWGALTMGMPTEANAAEAPGGAGASDGGGEAQAISVARATADQIRGIFAGLNLTAEGQRLIESLAAGMRAGIPAVQSAASSAAAAAAGNALRGAYHDGAR